MAGGKLSAGAPRKLERRRLRSEAFRGGGADQQSRGMLPFALVLVAGLGIAADASSTSPTGTADSLGLAGLVSSSVASAAKGSSRWYALASASRRCSSPRGASSAP